MVATTVLGASLRHAVRQWPLRFFTTISNGRRWCEGHLGPSLTEVVAGTERLRAAAIHDAAAPPAPPPAASCTAPPTSLLASLQQRQANRQEQVRPPPRSPPVLHLKQGCAGCCSSGRRLASGQGSFVGIVAPVCRRIPG